MVLSEFQLIERFFSAIGEKRHDVVLRVGDDAAVLTPPAGHELVVSTDTLVAGVHFFEDVDPEALGHKALAVNLSDIAAMGAQPAWVTLALTLPSANEEWLAGFSKGFNRLARRLGVELVGGDTTRGPLAITVQVMGHVEQGCGWRRATARPDDLIYVTGTLGDAGLALQLKKRGLTLPEQIENVLTQRLERPDPRVGVAQALKSSVSAAIDLSDGLLSDLGHLLKASGVGATVEIDRLPLSPQFVAAKAKLGEDTITADEWLRLPLAAGDDYELCFTVSSEMGEESSLRLKEQGLKASCIGVIDSRSGLRCLYGDGTPFDYQQTGYDNFR